MACVLNGVAVRAKWLDNCVVCFDCNLLNCLRSVLFVVRLECQFDNEKKLNGDNRNKRNGCNVFSVKVDVKENG